MNHLFRAICSHMSIGLLLFSYSYAGGNYYVGKDGGGIYLQTDNDGGWYIDSRDLRHFNIGESGNYQTGMDQKGKFILIDDKKFYIDTGHKESVENEIAVFNEVQQEKFKNVETPVSIDGNRVLVPVTISYSGKIINANLLLDTGASIVTLHRTIADKLKIYLPKEPTCSSPGGNGSPPMSSGSVMFRWVRTRKRMSLPALSITIDPSADYDGLLGMNFSEKFAIRDRF